MTVGDQVVFTDDEPVLDLREGTFGTVMAFDGPDWFVVRCDDGRAFTAHESSLTTAIAYL